MKFSQAKIQELWRLRAAIYNGKKQGTWSAFLVPPFLMLVGPISFSGFEKTVIFYSVLGYIAYLATILISIHKLKRLKNRKHRGDYPYNLIALLKSIHDLGFISMIFASFWMTAIHISFQILSPPIIARFSSLMLIVYMALLILFSPKIINHRSINRPERGNRYLPLALVISGAAPGLGILAYSIFSNSSGINFTQYFLMFGSLIVSVSVLPIIVINFFEILVLTFNEWPKLKKSGSQFVVVNPKEQEVI